MDELCEFFGQKFELEKDFQPPTCNILQTATS